MIVMELRSMDSPRPKKVSTGHFFAPTCGGAGLFASHASLKNPIPQKGYGIFWRRVRDSNPRSLAGHEISSFAPSTTRTTLQLTPVLYQQPLEKSRLFRQVHHIAHLLHNAVEGILAVGTQATGTVLNALLRV